MEEPIPIMIPDENELRKAIERDFPMLENFQHSETVVLNCPVKKMFEIFMGDEA